LKKIDEEERLTPVTKKKTTLEHPKVELKRNSPEKTGSQPVRGREKTEKKDRASKQELTRGRVMVEKKPSEIQSGAGKSRLKRGGSRA